MTKKPKESEVGDTSRPARKGGALNGGGPWAWAAVVLGALLLVLAACSIDRPGAPGRGEAFVVDRHCDGVARILQNKIPGLALDGLFEASRGDAEWHYAFWTRIEKTWVEEVRVTVRQI